MTPRLIALAYRSVRIAETFRMNQRQNARRYHCTFDVQGKHGRVTNAVYCGSHGVRSVWIDPEATVYVYREG